MNAAKSKMEWDVEAEVIALHNNSFGSLRPNPGDPSLVSEWLFTALRRQANFTITSSLPHLVPLFSIKSVI
jgi:hypothetical protein